MNSDKVKEGRRRAQERWSDPITRELLLLEYYVKHPDTWYGSVTYPSRRWYERHKYCHKFDDSLKERVRAFFNYQCAECGTPQNGKGLDVHHVNEKKDACCNHEVKRLFVPLCPYCHGLIQRDRAYWKERYTALINEYYGGKCYFTKDEYREWYAMP